MNLALPFLQESALLFFTIRLIPAKMTVPQKAMVGFCHKKQDSHGHQTTLCNLQLKKNLLSRKRISSPQFSISNSKTQETCMQESHSKSDANSQIIQHDPKFCKIINKILQCHGRSCDYSNTLHTLTCLLRKAISKLCFLTSKWRRRWWEQSQRWEPHGSLVYIARHLHSNCQLPLSRTGSSCIQVGKFPLGVRTLAFHDYNSTPNTAKGCACATDPWCRLWMPKIWMWIRIDRATSGCRGWVE